MTANAAAAQVRHEILRKMDALAADDRYLWDEKWEKLLAYISGMARRASDKKGGLGKK